MIDLHMHLIPGVDDGAMDTNMALSMLLSAQDQGILTIFATPHSSAFDGSPDMVLDEFSALQHQAEGLFPNLKLYLGCEVRCEERSMPRVLKKLHTDQYPTMNATRYVLTEFSTWVRPDSALYCAKKLVKAGWVPIIAHMERYVYLQNLPEVVEQLRAMGCLIQVNVYSVLEEEDAAIKDWARWLVAQKKADFLGTDAHRTYHRPPSARPGLDWLYENHEKDYIDAIAWGNAQ